MTPSIQEKNGACIIRMWYKGYQDVEENTVIAKSTELEGWRVVE
jgi:hypothetical protein